MYEYNENDIRNNGIHTFDDAEQEELYYKMLHTLFYRGFYAADNKDCEDKRFFSREKQNAEAKRIKREDQLSRDLQKAKAFIYACGLADDFARYKFNKTRNTELE